LLQAFDELIARYSEPHRRYHSVRHLEECFSKVDETRALTQHPGEVEAALWFHDAIYDTHRHDNEARSADWAKAVLSEAPPIVADRVHALIIATRHQSPAQDIDAQVLVDVDLSILGAHQQRFDEYEAQIREEYRWVPYIVYRQQRNKILRSLLSRSTIFATAPFIERYELQARSNIARSLK
jgi:predicted metal-dependent HD superfamily phosphohydrolase